ncbi:bifunctional nicotinamidase/pyrazinamidase [Rosenbergiella australiborealis]|uniref:nicotinamidase n=1 Tax=Rosenbergiella australiborealis TaxID=1544696 RepID=A0ABS5T6W6_9GAMM|nr:bifunctional nicotinamidase/pyrazinamidase [Rosenbergiella australiborealis]MBT0727857.1 bifunctional nicotinamidase/pyrazinamidase [Rosenbergiella australiborealis]
MAAATLNIDNKTALLVVDVQNDFMPNGPLAVPQGNEVIPVINRIAAHFHQVVITQDWHPAGHLSFSSAHPDCQDYQTITMPYGPQCLWPEHCIQGSKGAELAEGLAIPHARLILRKGIHREIDSYSAFLEADRRTATGLLAWLQAHDIHQVVVVGLATDFCVGWTAIDAAKAGLSTWVVEDACRAIDLNGSLSRAKQAMQEAGVKFITAAHLHHHSES